MSRQNLRKKQKKSALFAETTYPRKGTVTKHDSELGNAPSYRLFDAVHVQRADGVTVARQYSDYVVTVEEDLPAGVTCQRMS